MSPVKILIVDDEHPVTELMTEALQMAGFDQVESASNGAEGLEKYKSFGPDLVIMDIQMPVMDGYESSRRIKSMDPDARILVLTGNPSDHRAKKTIQEGFALELLLKPLRLKDLRRIIQDNLLS
jgi:CheY-like chemotaxis protein